MWFTVTGYAFRRIYRAQALQRNKHMLFSVATGKMKVKVGVVQLCSTIDKLENVENATHFIEKAADLGAKIVFLPECFDFVGTSREDTVKLSEAIDGDLIKRYCSLATKKTVWLSLGGFHRKLPETADDRICNTHVVVDDVGSIRAMYDKAHLFDVNIGGSSHEDNGKSFSIMESKVVRPGDQPPPVVPNSPVGSLGLAICYDMRFPELASHLRYSLGAQVLTYPSAFSLSTGQAGHWHTLLRARAIENQCYVVAAAQEGQHNPKRASYGHSLVVDPWGKVVAERTEPGQGLLLCDLDLDPIAFFRESLPVWQHRRFDLFPMPDSGCKREIGCENYTFGDNTIPVNHVFYRSQLSYAFVNVSPLVPGHVLVSPTASVVRYASLTQGQAADLHLTVKRIAGRLCAHYSATSLTVNVQDGEDAGQSVPHVHVHILPRKPNDFPQNDDIYQKLQTHDKVANRVYRTNDVMAAEAAELRKLFY